MCWILPHAAKAKLRIALTLGALLLLLAGCLRIEIRDRVRYRWSTAESGLALREGPGLKYARLGTIPFGARVRTIETASGKTVLASHVGRWNKVAYRGLLGYSFDAFLAEAPPGSLPNPAGHGPVSTASGAPPLPPDPAKQDEEIKRPRKPSYAAGPEKAGVQGGSPEKPTASAAAFAYAVNDIPGLIKLSNNEFNEIVGSLETDFFGRKAAFNSSAGEWGQGESVEDYLKRSEGAKRRFLDRLRRQEHAAATRVYSIYDARLELGPYDPGLGRFAWLGTTVPIDAPGETITTLPDVHGRRHRFVNGRKYDVDIPLSRAAAIRDALEDVRVRIDFSYTESLQDLFNWTLKSYFLPRYLMLYNRRTGRIYYACRTLPRVELNSDPVVPPRIGVQLLEEAVY